MIGMLNDPKHLFSMRDFTNVSDDFNTRVNRSPKTCSNSRWNLGICKSSCSRGFESQDSIRGGEDFQL